MPELTRLEDVFVLDLGADENRFHPDWMRELDAAFADVEAAAGPRALVTVATGKFWSNGLDLAWVGAHPEELGHYVDTLHDLVARLISLPVPTVAAVQGHAFAAGAILALAHDHRVMRADRGFICLPEVDIQIPFTPGLTAFLRSRLTPPIARRMMISGHRYGGAEALAAGIVDETADEDTVRQRGIDLAASLTTKAGPTLGTIKTRLDEDVLRALQDRSANTV
ncbi:enoyl-CoA hydratase-related protein [Streptomyces sp. NPDC047108]|uniref:enoyl-CoA hydratase-related protein n=1 Tax=Streptomyces sp. NPDC047108 TaxID=3155025 RepID=UPI0033D34362